MGEMTQYWRWAEGVRIYAQIPQGAKLTLGIDVGSVSSEAVLCADGTLVASSTIRTGKSSPGSALDARQKLLDELKIPNESISFTVGTGYGRVNVPFAQKTVTEIACHARGAHYMGGSKIRTILDMGGQDVKVIRIDENGRVLNFAMNDKCAAGTGRGMEVIADLLKVPVEELGRRSFEIEGDPVELSNPCVVFAKSEAMSLLAKGVGVNMVIASYCRAMAERVAGLIRKVGVEPEFFITGGISKNIGVTRRIEEIIGLKAVVTDCDAQIAGALGAALFAWDFLGKE